MNFTKHENDFYTWEDFDGSKNFFNQRLFMDIRNAREARGLPVQREMPIVEDLTNQLKDKRIFFNNGVDRDKPAFVQSVHKGWYFGYYLDILYYTKTDKGNRSHGSFTYKNISSINPIIIRDAAKYTNVTFK